MAPDCQHILEDQAVHNVLCGCDNATPANYNASKSKIENICRNEDFRKYLRRRDFKAYPDAVACPSCDAVCHHSGAGADSTEVKCTVCGYSFCSVHGTSHSGMSCAEFEASRPEAAKEADALSSKFIAETAKPCPHCKTQIFHAGGCNHVICSNCRKDFCFQCGSAEFLEGRMFRTCKKCKSQYFDHRYNCEIRAWICILLPIWLPIFLIWMATFLVLFVATLGCCCLGCGSCAVAFVQEDRGPDAKVRPADVARCILQPCCGPILQILLFLGPCGYCLIRPLLTGNQLIQMGLGPETESVQQDNDIV